MHPQLPCNPASVLCTAELIVGSNIEQARHLHAITCSSLPQVLNSGQESKKSIAPFLAIPALRRVISTFANDPSGQFANWSTNPEVCAMQPQHQTACRCFSLRGMACRRPAAHVLKFNAELLQ
jgi:hypothetical protein